jgi:hypothetical protein
MAAACPVTGSALSLLMDVLTQSGAAGGRKQGFQGFQGQRREKSVWMEVGLYAKVREQKGV